MLRKKSPKRLYVPTKKKWYTRPRRRSTMQRSHKILPEGINTFFNNIFQNAFYFIILGIIFIGIILFITFSSYFAIIHIEVARENFNIDSTAIESHLNQHIGKNIIFFSRHRIIQTVKDKFPEFKEVRVKKILPHTIQIHLESHSVIANLRVYYTLPEAEESLQNKTALDQAIAELNKKKLLDEKALNKAFLLDDTEEEEEEEDVIEQKSLLNQIGQSIFDQEENLELPIIIIRNLTQPIKDREQVIPPEHIDYIFKAIQYFTDLLNMKIIDIEYLPIAREIHIKTDQNFIIWITFERDFKVQIDKLYTIYEPAEFNKEELNYIDLRVRDKVIYCPKRSQCAHY